jgi:dienelactone hydrolase
VKLTLRCRPDEVGVADPFPATVTGLEVATPVRLRVSCADARGAADHSEALFVADENGMVDPCRDPAVDGSYLGVDPFGLWWSLTGPAVFNTADGFPTMVQAVVDRGDAVEVEFERRWLLDGIRREPVSDAGLVGVVYLPSRLPAPGVVVVGGSDGALETADPTAAGLARCGFVSLALAYFGLPGLPPRLEQIPLEYFESALEWIARRADVAGERVGVLGRSRGAELALLLGATFPRIGAVVGIAPSGVVWEAPTYDRQSRAAWIHNGAPVPFALNTGGPATAKVFARPPFRFAPLFEEGLSRGPLVTAATIPVERTRGPLLLISGGDDQLWPSQRLADVAMRRLRDHDREGDAQHLSYPQAGHFVGSPPFIPMAEVASRHPRSPLPAAIDYGGSPDANGRASSDAWPRIAEFLRTSLTESS